MANQTLYGTEKQILSSVKQRRVSVQVLNDFTFALQEEQKPESPTSTAQLVFLPDTADLNEWASTVPVNIESNSKSSSSTLSKQRE